MAECIIVGAVGSFGIGIVAALAARNSLDPKISLFLKVGIYGGFTTFSSFALETNQLMAKGQIATSVCYVTLSVLFGVLAVFAAQKIFA